MKYVWIVLGNQFAGLPFTHVRSFDSLAEAQAAAPDAQVLAAGQSTLTEGPRTNILLEVT